MSDPITRLNAALQGRYTIERELGEGGMATVYLARDEKHNRNVALKVLKPELAAVVGAERFLAEIETTANLQHPHILPLFDSGEADSFLFYVMPYVEGETLRDRLDRDHQLPVEDAVQIAKNVAEALDYAHRQGVIHRDIKPANILLQDGKPVISDFGIALAVSAGGAGRLTETGLSLGTPHYMSPEQATGDLSVGAPTDVYALGCVLYEMLVAEPPYTGGTPQAILGKIVTGDADPVTKHRKSVQPNVEAAIRKALEKVPADRFATAQDFSRALADPGFRYGGETILPATGRRAAWQGAALVGVAVGLLLGVGGTVLWSGGDDLPTGLVKFTIDPPSSAHLGINSPWQDVAISRDGRQIAYNGDTGNTLSGQIRLRPIDQLAGAPLRGAERGVGPFFSPDSEWVGFIDRGSELTLHKVSILGGAPVQVAQSPTGMIRGASWGADDRIVFGTSTSGLFRVSAGGGEPEALTTSENPGAEGHRWPSIIDGREAVLFAMVVSGVLGGSQLAVLDLSTREVKRLGVAGSSPRYVATGHLVYAAEDGSLHAAAFDLGSLEVAGSSVPLVEGIALKRGGAANFSVSEGGRLIYSLGSGLGGSDLQLMWVDREGGEEPLPMPMDQYQLPRLSPDGQHVALSIPRADGMDLWKYDVSTGAGLLLTSDDGVNRAPIWSPNGRHIFFSSTNEAPRPASATGTWWGNVYTVPADGSGPPTRVSTTEHSQAVTGITPDGGTLLYTWVQAGGWEIMAMPADGSAEATPFGSGPFRRGTATVSPNGRWVAYRSDESGVFEVYVEAFPGPGARVPVSIGGGTELIWSQDGRELFYLGGDRMMMAATITGDSIPRVGDRTGLFSTTPYALGGTGLRQYHVAPDGRFLMMRAPTAGESGQALRPQITVVLNWFEDLKARVPD